MRKLRDEEHKVQNGKSEVYGRRAVHYEQAAKTIQNTDIKSSLDKYSEVEKLLKDLSSLIYLLLLFGSIFWDITVVGDKKRLHRKSAFEMQIRLPRFYVNQHCLFSGGMGPKTGMDGLTAFTPA